MSDWLRASGVQVGFAVLASSTVVLVVCLLACRTLLRNRPAACSAVCTSTLLTLLAIPALAVLAATFELGLSPRAVTSPLPAPQAIVPRIYPPVVGAAPGDPVAYESPPGSTIDPVSIAAGLWLTIFALTLLPLAASWWRSRALLRRSAVVTDPRWCALRERVDRELHMTGPYDLRASDQVQVPVAVGLLRPCVLLPTTTIAGAPDSHAAAVLAHEVGHVVRRDAFGALLARVAIAVHWHHPLAWWLQREAAIAREDVCDNHALGVATPHELSEALLAWTTATGSGPGPLVHSVRGWSLERRVRGLLTGRRDVASRLPVRVTVALFVGLGALAIGTVSACTPRGSSEAPGTEPVAATADDPLLDTVLVGLGWSEATDVSLEFVHDYGGRGEGFRLADGRPIPSETTWDFPNPRDLLLVLSEARTTRYNADAWPEAKAAFILHGKAADGRRLQISFHARAGSATVSRALPDGTLEGGAWSYSGADDALLQLMQTRVPAAVELPLRHPVVWRVSSDRAPPSHEIHVARSATDLGAHLRDLVAPSEAVAPERFDYAAGVAIVVRAPTLEPLRDLGWGTPVLRHGTEIVELVFQRPATDAEPGSAAVMLLFVEVHDPDALESVALVFLDDTRVELSLK